MARRIAPLLFAVVAVIMWAASRMTWVTAQVSDDKSGEAALAIIGGTWSLELMAVSLLLLAGAVAGLTLRRTARRLVAVVCALAGVGAAWSPLQLLAQGAPLERTQDLLQAGKSNTNAVETTAISDWAVVTDTQAHTLGPVIAVLAGVVAVLAGLWLAIRPGRDTARGNKYETAAARQDKLAEDLRNSPDSGRVMWDALDNDIDPTDLPARGDPAADGGPAADGDATGYGATGHGDPDGGGPPDFSQPAREG